MGIGKAKRALNVFDLFEALYYKLKTLHTEIQVCQKLHSLLSTFRSGNPCKFQSRNTAVATFDEGIARVCNFACLILFNGVYSPSYYKAHRTLKLPLNTILLQSHEYNWVPLLQVKQCFSMLTNFKKYIS